MFGHAVGLFLLGLGISSGPFTNPNVKGAETVASPTATTRPPFPGPAAFHLDTKSFPYHATASANRVGVEITHPSFDMHAYGMGVLQMQTNFTMELEASRAAAQAQFASAAASFRAKLTEIRDTNKQKIVDTINTNCETVNQNRADKMSAMLAKLSTILTNVSNRAASASAAGKDTTTVANDITTAQTAIADAQAAVAAQAGTVCTVNITSEANLKNDVGSALSGLAQGLSGAYTKVVAARQAVVTAIRALATLMGESL